VGGDEAIKGLTASLYDTDMNVAAAAAEGLGAVGTSEVVPELLRILELESGDFLNFNILAALATIGVPGALPPVIKNLPVMTCCNGRYWTVSARSAAISMPPR